MVNNDESLIFEAYVKIYEAPIDPGASFDDPDIADRIDTNAKERLGKYKISDTAVINAIVIKVKSFLTSHENSHYPGSYKDFRQEIVNIVRDEAGIGSANAGYAARVIQNELRRLNVIAVDKQNNEVVVKDVQDKEDAIDHSLPDDVERGLEKHKDVTRHIPKKQTGGETGVIFSKKYDIEKDVVVKDDDLQAAKNELIQSRRSLRPLGREIIEILRDRFGYASAKKFAGGLVVAGVLVPEEEEAADDSKEIEALDTSHGDPKWDAWDMTQGGTETIGTADW